MDDGIGDGAGDDDGSSIGVIDGDEVHGVCNCDEDWYIDDIFGGWFDYYYYYYFIITLLLSLDSICIGWYLYRIVFGLDSIGIWG